MASASSGLEQKLVESPSAVLVNRNLTLFKLLVAGFGNDPAKQSLAISHAAKFKLWAGTLGAHRPFGSRSLEYRLRDASFIRIHVLSLLQELCNSIEEGVSLLSGGDTRSASREDLDSTLEELAGYFQDGEEELEDELGTVLKSIGHEISCLLRLSVAIRNPAAHDQFKSRAGVEIVKHFKHWDMQHIKAKFPDVESDILERLARATSRRRQYFKYREEHTARLSEGLDGDAAVTLTSPAERATTLASSLPDHLRDLEGVSEPQIVDHISEASGTSYATSISAVHRLQVPPIPKEHGDGPIKCPFCHMFALIHNRNDWKRHVFRDLQPYICLIDDCSVPDHLYSRRAHWMEHIKKEHWKVWYCAFGCPSCFHSKKDFQTHLQSTHGQEISGTKLASLECLSGKADASKPKKKCPLCANFWCDSDQKYAHHVGRHLEDLALFALPNTRNDEGSDESDESDVEESSCGAVTDIDALAAMTTTDFAIEPTDKVLESTVNEGAGFENRDPSQGQAPDSDTSQDSTPEPDIILTIRDEESIAGKNTRSEQQQPVPQVTFGESMSYVRTVKKRFENQPGIYKEFLEVLRAYQRDQKPVLNVYAEVATLFHTAPDLLEKFKQFLPQSPPETASEAQRRSTIYAAAEGPDQVSVVDSTMASANATQAPFNSSHLSQDRKAFGQPSNYWSVAELTDFPLLLAAFGSDWNAIASHMGSKSAVMVKNHFIRQKDLTRPELEKIVMEADAKRMRGEDMPAPPMYTEVIRPRRYDVLPPVPGQPGPRERPAGDLVRPSTLPGAITNPDSATFAKALDSDTTPSADTSMGQWDSQNQDAKNTPDGYNRQGSARSIPDTVGHVDRSKLQAQYTEDNHRAALDTIIRARTPLTAEEMSMLLRFDPLKQSTGSSVSQDENENRRGDATDIARPSFKRTAEAGTMKAGDAGHEVSHEQTRGSHCPLQALSTISPLEDVD